MSDAHWYETRDAPEPTPKRSREGNVILGIWYGAMPGLVLSFLVPEHWTVYVTMIGCLAGLVIGWRRPHD